MGTPAPNPPEPTSAPNKGNKPAYISSSGNMLESPPLAARVSRFTDTIYNFVGLYLVSLLSLDPYIAARDSQFNTMGRGPNAYQQRARWGGVNRTTGWGRGGGGGGDGRGPGAGGGGGSAGGGRRMGTVDDVRGPECGSCQ